MAKEYRDVFGGFGLRIHWDFAAEPIVRGVFGDPKVARTLKRRSKTTSVDAVARPDGRVSRQNYGSARPSGGNGRNIARAGGRPPRFAVAAAR